MAFQHSGNHAQRRSRKFLQVALGRGQPQELAPAYVLLASGDELYQKFSIKYKTESQGLKSELAKSLFDCSNLEIAVEKCLTIASKLSTTWRLSDFNGKQKLQYLEFPEGIRYVKEKRGVQTLRINELFSLIEPPERVQERKNKGNFRKSCLKSYSVTALGFKPKTF